MSINEARRKVYMADLRLVMKQMIDHIKDGEIEKHKNACHLKN
jgi:hypothetical protein